MEIPQDLIRLLSLAVRDAVWYKDGIAGLLKNAGVPASVLRKYNAQKKATATMQLLPEIIADLQALGPHGDLPLQRLFTQMCNWKDFASLKVENRPQAQAAVKRCARRNKPTQQKPSSRSDKLTKSGNARAKTIAQQGSQ